MFRSRLRPLSSQLAGEDLSTLNEPYFTKSGTLLITGVPLARYAGVDITENPEPAGTFDGITLEFQIEL